MRRGKFKTKQYRFSIICPWFFWKECCMCKYEIRREKLYKIQIDWIRKKFLKENSIIEKYGGCYTDTYHFCSKCCLNSHEAEQIFVEDFLPLYDI